MEAHFLDSVITSVAKRVKVKIVGFAINAVSKYRMPPLAHTILYTVRQSSLVYDNLSPVYGNYWMVSKRIYRLPTLLASFVVGLPVVQGCKLSLFPPGSGAFRSE